ncbi:MAG: methyltransferase regulatory domain-containing protein [Burkholderiales bacterium]|nr:methyltransferase regulatory domain-containing protein [Burkholderiales bacterium]
MSTNTLDSYDDLPYESLPLPDTHPDYLRAIASLYGVKAAPMDSCRVLELGCAGGGNILPLAWYQPNCTVVGVELAQRHVSEANALIAELNLNNAQVLHRSITDPLDDLDEFDYILAHGVFSWVPRAVQDRLLQICGQHLAPNGIAYVSYNTLPGWHLRGLLRASMLAYCGAGRASQRLAQAYELFDLMAPALRTQNTPEAQFALQEIDYLRRAPASYVYHEYLEETNEPLTFSDFMARAGQAGLSYLGDAELWTMFPSTLGNAGAAFEPIIDRIQQEQHLDFARLRKFRRTLLIRQDTPPLRTVPDLLALSKLAYYADLSTEEEIDLSMPTAQTFTGTGGHPYLVTHPLAKAGLMLLALRYPASLSWDELFSSAADLVTQHGGGAFADDSTALRTELFSLIAYQGVRPTLASIPALDTLPERPCAHRLARTQAARGHIVASIRHSAVELDPLGRELLLHLDGTRILAELAALMAEALHTQGQAVPDTDTLCNACAQMLWTFTRQGLLET